MIVVVKHSVLLKWLLLLYRCTQAGNAWFHPYEQITEGTDSSDWITNDKHSQYIFKMLFHGRTLEDESVRRQRRVQRQYHPLGWVKRSKPPSEPAVICLSLGLKRADKGLRKAVRIFSRPGANPLGLLKIKNGCHHPPYPKTQENFM